MTVSPQTVSSERWQKLSLAEQMGNIGSEVHRAHKAQGVHEIRFLTARDRALGKAGTLLGGTVHPVHLVRLAEFGGLVDPGPESFMLVGWHTRSPL